MSIRAELGQYILQKHNSKILKIQWGLNSPSPLTCLPLGTPVADDDGTYMRVPSCRMQVHSLTRNIFTGITLVSLCQLG